MVINLINLEGILTVFFIDNGTIITKVLGYLLYYYSWKSAFKQRRSI